MTLDKIGSYTRVDNKGIIEVKLSFASIFEGFFSPHKKRLNGKEVYVAEKSGIDASIDKTTHLAKKLEPRFWNILKTLAPKPEINYVSLLGYFDNLKPKFDKYKLLKQVEISRFNELKIWSRILKKLYSEYELKFSLLDKKVYSLGRRKKLGKSVDFILKRICPKKSEFFLLSCTGIFGRVLRLYNKYLNVSELQETVDKMRYVVLPKI